MVSCSPVNAPLELRRETDGAVKVLDVEPDKRQRILQAAAELIVRDGLQSPMSAIAKKSGVAMGSIYNYFPSKTDLIRGVYAQLADQTNAKLAGPIDRNEPHRERIMTYIHAYIDFFWEDWDRAILFEYLSNAPLIPMAELEEVFGATRTYNNTLFSEARRDGVVKPYSTRFMAGMIGGGIRNALKWHRSTETELTGEQRRQIAHMCWDAIALPGHENEHSG